MRTTQAPATQPATTVGRRHGRLRSAVLAGAIAVIPVGATIATASPAAASAYTCTGYGLGVPKIGQTSQFCAQTDGTGTYVRTAGAGYSAPVAWAGWLTNTRIKVEFIDSSGTVYWSAVSAQQNGGSAVGAWKFTLNSNMRAGTVRYTLLSNGAEIAKVQHTIR